MSSTLDPPPPEPLSGQQATSLRLGELSLRVLDNISAMVAYWDADQVCRFANQAYMQWFGKSREQLLGTSMRDLLGPIYSQNLPYILGALRGEPQVFERAIPTPSGVIRYSLATYTPDVCEGRVLGFFVHVSDVSLLKAAQQETEQAKKAAEAASRAKSEFLAIISHEIRTPMNAILGLTELLGRTSLDPRQTDSLEKIEIAGRSLLGIINEVLDFSKIEAGKLSLALREFALEDVLEELACIVGLTSDEKELEIGFLVAPDVPRCLFGDPGRLKQVLVNLIRNAVKFTERGEIALEVTREAGSSDKSVRLRFVVRDTGIGIPADQLEKIFEAFTQSDSSNTRSYGGTGLGLTISRRLVRMMDGELSAESTQGRGSTFHFTIPIGVRTADLAPVAAPAPLPGCLRLLTVGETPLVRRFLAETCSSFGWELITLDNPSEATRFLERSSQPCLPPDVVVVNWPRPDEAQLALVRKISDMQASDRPVFVFLVPGGASSSLPDAVRLGQGSGIDEIITKPACASVVHRTVVRALLRRGTASAGQRSPRATIEQSAERRLHGLRLLLVDDNPINLKVENQLFTMEGASIRAVESGRAALAALCAEPTSFDAVLMDVQMPELDGYQTTQEIRRNPLLAALPVIAISAGVLWEERDKCRAAGMNGFISKPLDLDEAVLLIDSLTARSGRITNSAGIPSKPAVADAHAPQVHFDIPGYAASARHDTATMTRLLILFLEDNVAMQSSIRSGLQRGDLHGIAQALHRMRGTAGVLGASRLSSAAWALERRLCAGDPASAHSELQEYEAALSEALHAARSFLRAGASVDQALGRPSSHR